MWYTHWQCQFQSMNGTQYAVNICKQTARTGDIVQLVGASQPFSTQEDDSDDIFTPIRTQTGYLRVIDTDGTLLANLVPANNTERLVQLWSGSNVGGTFTPSALRWQGFLQAQAYTQPWDNNASILELPVKSLLGALEDVSIDETAASTEQNVAALILAAFDNFGLVTDNDLTHLVITADVSDAPNTLLKPFIQMSVFFDKETVNNQGDSYEQLVGQSYYEALSAVMSLYGLQLREDGTKIYMNQFDGLDVRVWSIGWGFLTNIAGGSSIVVTPTVLPSVDMLTALTFKGADNIAGYSQGGRSAKVTLGFSKIDDVMCDLPSTTEDASTVYDIRKVYNGTVKVQPHEPRTNSIEEFIYLHYIPQSGYEDATYDQCVQSSAVHLEPEEIDFPLTPQITGAFPVRWSFALPGDSKAKVLLNGLMINTVNVGTEYYREAYRLRTPYSYSHYSGFINIILDIATFAKYEKGVITYYYYGNYGITGTIRNTYRLKLRWGSKYWNGTEWTTSESYFEISTDGQTIISNKDDYKDQIDVSSGYLIPVLESLSGEVELTIMNSASGRYDTEDSSLWWTFRSSLISKLSVDYLSKFIPTESSRTNNTYRRNILTSGFSEEKSIDLKIGTYNNNYDSVSFIKQNLTTYIERFPYIDASAIINQRPELHLLDRMVYYYGYVRRMFRCNVLRGLDYMQTLYGYNYRSYFGVKTSTEWRDDTEEVKFIEV